LSIQVDESVHVYIDMIVYMQLNESMGEVETKKPRRGASV